VLYAPGLRTKEDIAAGVKAVAPKPVNVVMGLSGADFSVAELAALGVKRISVGSAMARAAYGAFLRAAREVAERGTFTFARDAVPFAEINRILDR
jgi:2-methylisocitrate lyase-like PEP mutase family enzyme